MKKGATLSLCGQYRYRLWRVWDETKPKCMFIMLNPSTADAETDDPTIRRCIAFAQSWGYGGIEVCNLFAYRATDPKKLLGTPNPFGHRNRHTIRQCYDKVEIVVAAWGNRPIIDRVMKNYGFSEFNLIEFTWDKLYVIELGKQCTPKHPLYLKKDLKPIRLRVWADGSSHHPG